MESWRGPHIVEEITRMKCPKFDPCGAPDVKM